MVSLTLLGEKIQGEEDAQKRHYTVAQLNDLQSKLMLVAGKAEKGKEEVEKFVEVRLVQQTTFFRATATKL